MEKGIICANLGLFCASRRLFAQVFGLISAGGGLISAGGGLIAEFNLVVNIILSQAWLIICATGAIIAQVKKAILNDIAHEKYCATQLTVMFLNKNYIKSILLLPHKAPGLNAARLYVNLG